MNNRPIIREKDGFTLIELLIVIAIIGILAGVAIPLFLGQRTKAMKAEGETNIRLIFTANENYYAENGVYAPAASGTKTYGDGTANALEKELRAIKFGNETDLNFTYTLESCNAGQSFRAMATGKAGTAMEGIVYSLNERNEMGDGTVSCGS